MSLAQLGPHGNYNIRFIQNLANNENSLLLPLTTGLGFTGLSVTDQSHLTWNTDTPALFIESQCGIGPYPTDSKATAAWGANIIEPGVYSMEILYEGIQSPSNAGDQLIPFFDICNTADPGAAVERIPGPSYEFADVANEPYVVYIQFAVTRLFQPTQGGYTITAGIATRSPTAVLPIGLNTCSMNIERLNGVGITQPGVYA